MSFHKHVHKHIKNRKFQIIVGCLLFLFVVLLLYPRTQQNEANYLIDQGDKALQRGDPFKALEKYHMALESYKPYRSNASVLTRTDVASKQTRVTILLEDYVTEKDAEIFVFQLKKIQGVKQVDIMTKDEAYKLFQEQNRNDPKLLSQVTKDMMQIILDVYPSDISSKTQVIELAEATKSSLVQKVAR